MPNLAYFTENYFKWLYFCSVQLVIEGVIMTPEILEWKFKKCKSFLLTTVQQMQPALTLHCPKLVKNIKIRISCDVRVYTRKILRLSVFSFPPSWIWAIVVSSRSQSHEPQKWHPRSKYMYWGNIEVLQKFETAFKENCLQRYMYTKCVAFLELNSVKKKLSSLIMGHFPNASFRRSCDGSARNMQAINFSYFINLTRNSSTLRPLELDVQPTFCRFSSANEHEHMSDRSMLVLYPASALVSSVVSSCFICELILKVHKISFFKEYTLVCLLWKSQI